MNYIKWFEKNTESLEGKVVAVTGSTGGLGIEICNHLASLNAKLIFLNRNLDKSTIFCDELKKKYPNLKIKTIKLDLEDFDNVKEVTLKLKDEKVDFLIHNSGTYKIKRHKTSIGLDNIFQVNFFAPYYMTKELLKENDVLKVIVVGSISYKFSKLKEDDIDYSCVKNDTKVYGNSKRFLMYSMYELFKNKKENLTIAHPGITHTNIMTNYPKFISKLIKYPMKLIFNSPKKSSLPMIKAIFTSCDSYHWIGPSAFNIWGKPKVKKLKKHKNEESDRIFKIAENLYKKH